MVFKQVVAFAGVGKDSRARSRQTSSVGCAIGSVAYALVMVVVVHFLMGSRVIALCKRPKGRSKETHGTTPPPYALLVLFLLFTRMHCFELNRCLVEVGYRAM